MRFGLREMLFVVLLAAMPVVAYFYHFRPSAEEQAQARAEASRKLEKVAQLEKALPGNESIGEEIRKLQEVIQKVEERLPAQREEQVILKEVTELAQTHKLRVKSVRPEKAVKAASYAELPIRMTIVGDFDGFYSFLLELEKLPRITQLKKMDLEKQMSLRAEGEMQADVVLSIFFEGDAI